MDTKKITKNSGLLDPRYLRLSPKNTNFLTPSLRQLTEWSLDPLDEALDLIVDALKPPELRQNVWERN